MARQQEGGRSVETNSVLLVVSLVMDAWKATIHDRRRRQGSLP